MFGLLSKKARSEVGSVGGFGKVPALGDFVRTSSPCDEMIAFEAWLTRALESAEARAGSAFKDTWATALPHAFLWSSTIEKKVRGLYAGVLITSSDAVGRRFPLVIGAPLPPAALAGQPHVAPLVLHQFLHHAADAAARARQTRSAAEFQAQVVAIDPPSFDDASAKLASYTTWSKAQHASDMWTALFGKGDATRASRHALGMIVDATSPYRGQDTPPLTLGLRVPLGLVATDTRNIFAAWVDIIRHAAGWKSTVPSYFFPLGASNPQALIQLGAEPPPSILVDLFTPSADSDSVCDLAASERAAPPASVRGEVVAAESLADVVAALGR